MYGENPFFSNPASDTMWCQKRDGVGWCYVPAGYSVVGLPMILSGSKVVLVRLPSCSSKPVCYHSSVVLLCFNYNYRFTVIYLVISDIGKTLRAPNMCPV